MDSSFGTDHYCHLNRAIDLSEKNKIFRLNINKCLVDAQKFLFKMKALTYECCLHLQEKTKHEYTDSVPHDKYQILYTILNKNIHTQIQKIALKMNLSAANLSAQFKYDTGISISDYRNRIIIKHAAELLISTTLKIRECANRIGFEDELYFSRYFKKQTGLSPRDFRKLESTCLSSK